VFSGIISKLARVRSVDMQDGSIVAIVETGFTDMELGESIAVNGVCLTVTTVGQDQTAAFFISAETLDRSNLALLRPGMHVNLERALMLNTRLSGHLVQGHVDGKAVLRSIMPHQNAYLLELTLPLTLSRYCVEKGSIALNGISLTLNRVLDAPDGTTIISTTIIPHTWEHTNLNSVKVGDDLNVEVDVMAKYAERLCQPYLKP
jgi:riboflavin synthase